MLNFWIFYTYEHLKFHAHEKSFITSRPGFSGPPLLADSTSILLAGTLQSIKIEQPDSTYSGQSRYINIDQT